MRTSMNLASLADDGDLHDPTASFAEQLERDSSIANNSNTRRSSQTEDNHGPETPQDFFISFPQHGKDGCHVGFPTVSVRPWPLKVLVAPAAYKGCLQPDTAADCISSGVLSVVPDARVHKLPLIDGGEGFTRGIVTATGGTIRRLRVPGPLNEPVEGFFGILGSGGATTGLGQNCYARRRKTAIIEMSAAAGLSLVPGHRRNPAITTTYGVGKVMIAAMDAGADRIIIGCGDSATCDGGAGMLQALGAVLLDCEGNSLPIAAGGASILRLARVDLRQLDQRIAKDLVRIEAAVNWENVLTGSRGQARIYSQQKGASPEQVEMLSAAMYALANAAANVLHMTPEALGSTPGSGASGGMGTALLVIGGSLRARCEVMDEFLPPLDSLFEHDEDPFDLVITAEGGLDHQTPRGKMPAEVARRAKQKGIPVVAIAGTIGSGAADNYSVGINAYACILQGPLTLTEAMQPTVAKRLLTESAASVIRTVLVGMQIQSTKGWKQKGREAEVGGIDFEVLPF